MKSDRSLVPLSLRDILSCSQREEESPALTTPGGGALVSGRRTGFKTSDRVAGMLLGCAIGDALGMPVEGVDNAQTLRALRRLGGIRDFLAPQPHVLRSLRPLRNGCWTDDTQLTLAIARSMIETGRLDYEAVADAHVQAFETLELRGWDATTKQACRRLSQGTHRLKSGNLGGMSNTVAAKIAPIAAWSFVRGEDREVLLRHCLHVGQMTHYDPRAITGAYAIALLLRDALASPRRWDPPSDRYDQIVDEVIWAEQQLARHVGSSDDPLSQHLRELSDALDATPEEIAELSNGATSYVCYSVPFLVAFLCGRPWEFEDGVIAAVNCGGDTDTNGAIVGAVLGAACGAKKLPKRFADGVEESEIIRDVAFGLATILESAS